MSPTDGARRAAQAIWSVPREPMDAWRDRCAEVIDREAVSPAVEQMKALVASVHKDTLAQKSRADRLEKALRDAPEPIAPDGRGDRRAGRAARWRRKYDDWFRAARAALESEGGK